MDIFGMCQGYLIDPLTGILGYIRQQQKKPTSTIECFPQIGFGFCKGDDNYGGVKRKELDDFLKSLGKTYNLVLYRMQVLRGPLNPL